MRPLFAVLLTSLLVSSLHAKERLNVIVILADDLGWADLGCYGSKYHRTPVLDEMAKAGVRFTNAYASAPVCSPTRAALLTGKTPARLGITDWLPGHPVKPAHPLARPAIEQRLSLDEVTIAAALKKAGYTTGHIGKWHLGGKGYEPEKFGFATNIGGDDSGTPLSYFAPFHNKNRAMPGLEKAPEGEYLTDRLGAEAERFIDTNKDRPFFLYLAHYGVHVPLQAPKALLDKYPGKLRYGTQSNPIYAAMLESVDASVGRILRKLDALKLTDRTVVVFTSDNGGLSVIEGPNTPATINAPLREGKGFLYEGGIRVPLIVRWPSVESGTSSVPVISHDLHPTLLSACGVKPPKLDGIDLTGLITRKEAPKREALHWHYPHYSNQGGKPGGAIREGNLKLIEFYEDNRRELFDLATDPGENRNLARDRPEVVKRLAARLEAWRKQTGARMPKPNPDYVPNPPATDGSITMHARTARVTGTQLRYEPLPHKETLGYWVDAGDTAIWQFTATKAGTYTVEVFQGCGTGQGGSVVEVQVAGQTLKFTVQDTGGFQQFVPRNVGTMKIDKPGRYTLTLAPRTKSRAAVMDVRQVVLRVGK